MRGSNDELAFPCAERSRTRAIRAEKGGYICDDWR